MSIRVSIRVYLRSLRVSISMSISMSIRFLKRTNVHIIFPLAYQCYQLSYARPPRLLLEELLLEELVGGRPLEPPPRPPPRPRLLEVGSSPFLGTFFVGPLFPSARLESRVLKSISSSSL